MARKLKIVVLLSCAATFALVVILHHDSVNVFPWSPRDHPARKALQMEATYIKLGRPDKAARVASNGNLEPEVLAIYGRKGDGGSEATAAVFAGKLAPLPRLASLSDGAVVRQPDNRKGTSANDGDSIVVTTSEFATALSAQNSKQAQPTMDLVVFNDKLFLVSAYADYRKDPPSVKIVVFAHRSIDAQLYCYIGGRRYEARLTWINYPSEELAVWRAGYLECEVAGLATETSSFDVTDGGGHASVRMPLGRTLSQEPRQTFGLCVKSAYGAPSAERFVEWMELHALLGVEHVMLYAQDLRGPIVKAMRHYVDSGRLVVVKDNFRRLIEQVQPRFVDLFSTYDATHATGDEPYSQFELLSIQDCFHRFRGGFEYIIVTDIDEVIVPADGGTMHDLLRVLKGRAPTATSFAHRAASYLPNFAVNPIANSSAHMYMVEHTRRTEITWDGSKAFHSTADTQSLNWHRRIDPSSNVAYVDPEVAWLHHYRGSCKGFSCDSKVKVVDDGMTVLGKFAAALSSRVVAVREKLRNG